MLELLCLAISPTHVVLKGGSIEPETDTVPIIVGSVLAVIVTAVLVWYLVMRLKKRNV